MNSLMTFIKSFFLVDMSVALIVQEYICSIFFLVVLNDLDLMNPLCCSVQNSTYNVFHQMFFILLFVSNIIRGHCQILLQILISKFKRIN